MNKRQQKKFINKNAYIVYGTQKPKKLRYYVWVIKCDVINSDRKESKYETNI